MTIKTVEPSDLGHARAVELLQTACRLFVAGSEQMSFEIRRSLDGALQSGGALEVRVQLLPSPCIVRHAHRRRYGPQATRSGTRTCEHGRAPRRVA